MDGGNLFFAANLSDECHSPRIQFEDRAAVDDFQIAEFAGDLVQHLAVQGKIGVFIGAFVGVVIAERAFLVDASPAAQKDDFPFSFFQNFTISFHNNKSVPKGRLRAYLAPLLLSFV